MANILFSCWSNDEEINHTLRKALKDFKSSFDDKDKLKVILESFSFKLSRFCLHKNFEKIDDELKEEFFSIIKDIIEKEIQFQGFVHNEEIENEFRILEKCLENIRKDEKFLKCDKSLENKVILNLGKIKYFLIFADAVLKNGTTTTDQYSKIGNGVLEIIKGLFIFLPINFDYYDLKINDPIKLKILQKNPDIYKDILRLFNELKKEFDHLPKYEEIERLFQKHHYPLTSKKFIEIFNP